CNLLGCLRSGAACRSPAIASAPWSRGSSLSPCHLLFRCRAMSGEGKRKFRRGGPFTFLFGSVCQAEVAQPQSQTSSPLCLWQRHSRNPCSPTEPDLRNSLQG